MTESTCCNKSGDTVARPRGGRALLGAAIAIIGVLAAVNPANVLLVTLNQVMPQLADALLAVVTAGGAVLAALSDPPSRARRK